MSLNFNELEKFITSRGGKIQGGINWTWAYFDVKADGLKCYDDACKKFPEMESRGYYDETTTQLSGFRYR